MRDSDYEYLRIRRLALAAGTQPRIAWQRIKAGWSEADAVNTESRTAKTLETLRLDTGTPSFPRYTPPLSTTPMPKHAGPELMAQALEASYKLQDEKIDGENKYTKTIRELIEGKL